VERLLGQKDASILRRGRFPEAFFARLQRALLEEIERDPVLRGVAYLGLGELRPDEPLLAINQPEGHPATRIFAIGAASGDADGDVHPANRWVTAAPGRRGDPRAPVRSEHSGDAAYASTGGAPDLEAFTPTGLAGN
jgi:hypothetical protein